MEWQPRSLNFDDMESAVLTLIVRSPQEYGYRENFWTLQTLAIQLHKEKDIMLSSSEVKAMFDRLANESKFNLKTHYLKLS
jgi:hypothetical protein